MRSLCIAALTLLASVGASEAQTIEQRESVTFLLDLGGWEGWQPVQGTIAGEGLLGLLPRGGSVIVEVNLQPGRSYLILGVCERWCLDLNLRLFARGMGEVLGEDVERDSIAMLTVTPREHGPQMLAVMLPECAGELCYFGVRVFTK